MKISKNISLLSLALIASASPLWATVATLQEIQNASSNLSYQYTFEGTYSSGSGTWLDQKAGSGPNLTQGPLAPTRIAEQKTPGYDSSTNYAEFRALANGSAGDSLLSSTAITYATAGTIEYLVQFGTNSGGARNLIAGDGSGADDRLRFLATGSAGDKANMVLGANNGIDLIGGTTSVSFVVGNWYYVAQNWSIVGTTVTIDAWVANLTAGGALTQTISGATNSFVGDTTTVLNLGGASNTYANGNLDALAIYNSQLNFSTITSHYNAISVPEPSTCLLMGLTVAAFIPSLRRRLNRAG